MKQLISMDIEAIIPTYSSDGGNFTTVELVEGSHLIKKSVRSVIKGICRQSNYDLKVARKKPKDLLNITKTPPIPINENLTLLAAKTRVPMAKNDGAHAYVNLEQIECVKGNNIIFKSGKVLETLYKEKTLMRQKVGAYIVKANAISEKSIMVGGEKSISLEDLVKIFNRLEIVIKDPREDPTKDSSKDIEEGSDEGNGKDPDTEE